jgi:hypothetical protein
MNDNAHPLRVYLIYKYYASVLQLWGIAKKRTTIYILVLFMIIFWYDLEPRMNAILDMLIQELKSRSLELPS